MNHKATSTSKNFQRFPFVLVSIGGRNREHVSKYEARSRLRFLVFDGVGNALCGFCCLVLTASGFADADSVATFALVHFQLAVVATRLLRIPIKQGVPKYLI